MKLFLGLSMMLIGCASTITHVPALTTQWVRFPNHNVGATTYLDEAPYEVIITCNAIRDCYDFIDVGCQRRGFTLVEEKVISPEGYYMATAHCHFK